MRFLAIDDNEDDIEMLGLHLEDLGWDHVELVGCCEVSSAHSFLRKMKIDLVFLDYCLGEVSGLEVLQEFVENLPDHPPVILVTGQGSEEVAVDAIKNGAEDYLVKGTLKPDTIERAVSNALEKSHLKRLVADQEKDLIEAERQRVMFESVGAACHHFAQPLTTMIGYLELLSDDSRVDEEKRKIFLDTCLDSANKMSEIMDRFQTVREYRTRPYSNGGEILDIGIYEGESPEELPIAVNR